jgi:hypothetical protein
MSTRNVQPLAVRCGYTLCVCEKIGVFIEKNKITKMIKRRNGGDSSERLHAKDSWHACACNTRTVHIAGLMKSPANDARVLARGKLVGLPDGADVCSHDGLGISLLDIN